MSRLHRFVRAGLAKALYSPFGLAWLRARDQDMAATAYRNAAWPTPPLMLSALRMVQVFWPPRRTDAGGATPSHGRPDSFHSASAYSASTSADAYRPIVAATSEGPVIRVSGRVTPASMDPFLLAIARVEAAWPQAAWQLDIDARPAWLTSVLLLATSPPQETGRAPRITLAPPVHEADIDAFVAQALSAHELSP